VMPLMAFEVRSMARGRVGRSEGLKGICQPA
jgi:hypothetical protein